MILTTCAACAAPLAHDAPRCVRCKVRYCDSTYFVSLLVGLGRFEEAKSLVRKVLPVARRVLGEENILTLDGRLTYAQTLCEPNGATLDDLREGVATLEDVGRTARRVFGGAHPIVMDMERSLRDARAALRASEETPLAPAEDLAEEVD